MTPNPNPNPELVAALATVPDIARTEALLDDAKKRLREHPAGLSPDRARESVINDAVVKFQSTGTWPAGIGTGAATAYTTALEWEAERLARQQAKDSTELLAYDTRQLLASDALEFLGTRLSDVLSAAREAAETLGDARTAEDAIRAGGAVVAAWGSLQGLVEDLANIRAAQWTLLLPPVPPRGIVSDLDGDERREIRKWRAQGYGEVGAPLDDLPAFVRAATATGRYSAPVLLWLANADAAHVPTSYDDIHRYAGVADLIDVTSGADGRIEDLSPSVTPEPAPVPSKVFAHSSTPHLDSSQPAPAQPKPTASVSDPKPPNFNRF
ncbi:hypothetical protein [Streptomyces sp. NBC_00986]|uniref:hypothetical protein n=1 Tax=Streptomyces sp. NBC_00986 TaxID=2903702 RepID=UPI00386DBC3D|nr:hypothetical protein OG504_42780 [Streptomyces sp. NBC_00986]